MIKASELPALRLFIYNPYLGSVAKKVWVNL